MPLVAQKDPAAFEVFYDRHGGAAYSLAYRIVGDATSAEDVTQEAFLSIWRSRARYDPMRGSVRAWARGAARSRTVPSAHARTLPRIGSIDALRREGGRAPKL